jgi:hypothetical protein
MEKLSAHIAGTVVRIEKRPVAEGELLAVIE